MVVAALALVDAAWVSLAAAIGLVGFAGEARVKKQHEGGKLTGQSAGKVLRS